MYETFKSIFACIGIASTLGFIFVVILACCTPVEVEKEPETDDLDDDYNHVIF